MGKNNLRNLTHRSNNMAHSAKIGMEETHVRAESGNLVIQDNSPNLHTLDN